MTKITNLDGILNEFTELNNQAKAISKQLDELKNLIKSEMAQQGVTSIETPNHRANLTITQRTDVDKKHLQADYPEIWGLVTRVTSFQTLRVK